MTTGNTGGGTPPPPPTNTTPSMTGPTGTAITWVIRIVLVFVLLLLLKGGCNKSKEDSVSEKTENCNILRISELVGDTTYITFNYEFSVETQGEKLWFQFRDKDGDLLPPKLWTGKGTYDLIDRDKGRDDSPVKVWPDSSGQNVWLKISEVIKC